MEKADNIRQLLLKQLVGDLTDSENEELEQWLKKSPENREILTRLNEQPFLEDYNILNEFDVEKGYEDFLWRLEEPKSSATASRRIFFYKAVVIFILLAGSGGLYYFLSSSGPTKSIGKTPDKPVFHDSTGIFRKNNHAELILADGSLILLDNTRRYSTTHQGNVDAHWNNEGLVYVTDPEKSVIPGLYNTITVPAAARFRVTLPDGTGVWLNAESTLRYPLNFQDSARTVELAGEAYFEVTKEQARPFIVSTNETQVKVLGTRFNISAYPKESFLSTTLLSGLVELKRGLITQPLQPGQQGTLAKKQNRFQIKEADTTAATAWMQGKLVFTNEPLSMVLGKISRRYNVIIDCPKLLPFEEYNLVATFGMDCPVEELLRIIGTVYTDISFSVKNNTVIVRPNRTKN